MKLLPLPWSFGTLFLTVLIASGQEAAPTSLVDRVSYAQGAITAQELKQTGLPINADEFLRAFKTVFSGGQLLMSEVEISKAFDEIQFQMDAEKAQGEDKANLEAGLKFMAENAKKPEIKQLERGLQIQVIKEGSGPRPVFDDLVKVNYTGTLIDGTVFDTSKERGPTVFPLNQVIPGWGMAISQMTVGSVYKVFVPYYLAYGPTSPDGGKVIKPYSTLIFEIELLEITK